MKMAVNKFSVFVCTLVWFSYNGCLGYDRFMQIPDKYDISFNSDPSYKTLYFQQPVDHFSFANQDTFQLRYLVNDDHWDNRGGPIFFYCGNEGDIELFSNNTGAMWEWAPEFQAMVVFAEHRYYGKSMPYGQDSYKDMAHLGYLSSEQALADFARLITHMKDTIEGAKDSPVIAFGGSYGGMLASWFRLKYPSVIHGALAASAPIWMFTDMAPCNGFNKIVTADFQKSGPHCAENIKKSWPVLDNWAKTAEGLKKLSDTFKLCSPLKNTSDVDNLHDWLYGVYGNLAMVDYPYPANFLAPLPAWPIKEVCSHLAMESPSDDELMSHLADAVAIYYNYTGSAKCLNLSEQATSSLGDYGWDFQACSEMVMPICTDGVTDMFMPMPFNLTWFTADCKKRWGVVTRPYWAQVVYGGKDLHSLTNVIFSNGGLDPWSSGGVLMDLSESVKAVFIEQGAHHLDLRASNPQDPQCVIDARQQERAIIHQWIQEYRYARWEDYSLMRFKYQWLPGSNPIVHVHRVLLPYHGLLPFLVLFCLLATIVMLVARRSRARYGYVIRRHGNGDTSAQGLVTPHPEAEPLLYK